MSKILASGWCDMGMYVVKTDKKTCDAFVLAKHYSHRSTMFWVGFALVEDGKIQGVCVFGQPSPTINRCAFKDRNFRLYELARLVVQTKTKNASSFLVSTALKMLEPKPCAVISYADSEQGHCGFIYQATNWIYTGAPIGHEKLYIVDGKRVHAMSLYDKGITDPSRWAKENNIQVVKPHPKHRYFYFVGSKHQKAKMRASLVYPVVPEYPKQDPSRYDDGPTLDIPAVQKPKDTLEDFFGVGA